MTEPQRIIKKYPNRRLYDTHTSSYITLADVKELVHGYEDFVVVDAKTNDGASGGASRAAIDVRHFSARRTNWGTKSRRVPSGNSSVTLRSLAVMTRPSP